MPRRHYDTYTPAFTEFGQRLHTRRTELEIPVTHLERDTRIYWSHLRHIESGRTNPTLGTMLTIAQALHTDLAELVKNLPLPPPPTATRPTPA